ITLLLVFGTVIRANEPAEAFRPWSAFGQLDLTKLAHGRIETECNASMKFARGISTQAAFVVDAPIEVVVRTLLSSDPLRQKDSDVYQHRYFHDESDAHFDHLQLDPKFPAVQRLLADLRKGRDLQLSREAYGRLPRDGSLANAPQIC